VTSQRIIAGDCIEGMRTLPDCSVHCCVTSPPYWGLRDYGHAGQIGLESTPEEYVERMVAVFREVRRVLREDGTLWLNLGDSYCGGGGYAPDAPCNKRRAEGESCGAMNAFSTREGEARKKSRPGYTPPGLKAKDLVGIPWRVAFALQADGWYLRQDIIWHKPNPMPESVRDRCTKAHEYVFLLSKSPRYYYDSDAISEDGAWCGKQLGIVHGKKSRAESMGVKPSGNEVPGADAVSPDRRNRRSVWTITTKPYSGAHFAVMPPDLVEPCILAGCPAECCPKCRAGYERVVERTPMVLDRSDRTHDKGRTRASGTMVAPPTSKTVGFRQSCSCEPGLSVPGTVLDPFAGSGTTLAVAADLGRNAIGCELNESYIGLARKRIAEARAGVALFEQMEQGATS
jgi:DNA modification methylase